MKQKTRLLAMLLAGMIVLAGCSRPAADTPAENILASTHYAGEIPALVKSPNLPVYGAQFHPEKSHKTGLKILENFCKGEGI